MQNQHLLGAVLRSLFPSHRIVPNARKAAATLNPFSNQWLEVDYHIPDLKLGFEFQDVYHYATAYYARVPLDFVQQRDYFKTQRLQAKGETLISIPCWWDGLPDSLIATIREVRSDLLRHLSKDDGHPIPSSPPDKFFAEYVPDVGELMISSYASPSRLRISTKWWMSEKYDGIRACWNPNRHQLFSRSGRVFSIPRGFVSHFTPVIFIDCELWFGRGAFHESQLLALDFRTSNRDPEIAPKTHWLSLRAVSFDRAVSKTDEEHEFEQRFQDLLDAIPVQHPFITVAYNMSSTAVQIRNFSSTILEDGGEGVMLRAPNTVYQRGLSVNLLKLKAQRDHEALVVDYNGGYELELPDGTRFKAPTTPGVSPSVGDVVTFTYSTSKNEEEATELHHHHQSDRSERGREGWTPLDAVIVHVRRDVIWEEIIMEHGTTPRQRNANNLTQRLMRDTSARHPVGHWTRDDNQNAKELFIQFARARSRNAQDPEFWYSVRRSDLFKEKKTTTVIKNYGGSCAKAVLDLFPNIGLDGKRLFSHRRQRVKKTATHPLKIALHKTVKTSLKTAGIMKIWWKVHKNSI